MLTRENAGSIFDQLRRHSSADEIELLFAGSRSTLTRFANNTITQNIEEHSQHISVRVSFGGRTARATTNKYDEESLRRVVESAEALARVQEDDPELPAMPTAQEVAEQAPTDGGRVQRYFESTAALTPQARAAAVAEMVSVAERHSLNSAGTVSSAYLAEGIFNSRGVADWYEQTLAEVSITMLGDTSSGWQKANHPDVAQLAPKTMAEIAAQKAIASLHPLELPPGKYTVILEPSAVLDIVGFMFWDFGGSALLEQRSFLNQRIGTQLFGKNITVWDDVYDSRQVGAPFDGEGMKRHRLKLIENGVVQALTYARASAARMRRSELAGKVGPIAATGHGFPLPNEIGEIPMNLVFAGPPDGEAQTVDQMVASTERGILVTRLWYIREVDPYEKLLTGMTRDGTFLVENGRIKGGIRNFRFNESLVQMLSNVEAMSEPIRASGEESMDMVVPAMKVCDFNFTETTKF